MIYITAKLLTTLERYAPCVDDVVGDTWNVPLLIQSSLPTFESPYNKKEFETLVFIKVFIEGFDRECWFCEKYNILI